jgi:Uma2 family endonuclease
MTATARRMTVAEYLEHEKRSEVRHEYVDGIVLEMPGTTRTHGNIVKNIIKALDDIAQAKGCELQAVDIITRVRDTRYRYPDVVASCTPGTDRYVLENPCFILEVTSDSTADTDHGKKLDEYTKIESMQRYAIVSQKERLVIVYKRLASGWGFDTLEAEGEFEIPCLETSLSLDQIYAGIPFED